MKTSYVAVAWTCSILLAIPSPSTEASLQQPLEDYIEVIDDTSPQHQALRQAYQELQTAANELARVKSRTEDVAVMKSIFRDAANYAGVIRIRPTLENVENLSTVVVGTTAAAELARYSLSSRKYSGLKSEAEAAFIAASRARSVRRILEKVRDILKELERQRREREAQKSASKPGSESSGNDRRGSERQDRPDYNDAPSDLIDRAGTLASVEYSPNERAKLRKMVRDAQNILRANKPK